jgi:hypothetical protein
MLGGDMKDMKKIGSLVLAGLVLTCIPVVTQAQTTLQLNPNRLQLNCDDENSGLCPELATRTTYEGRYSGHDEPSLLFHSNVQGSGNSSIYLLTLPKDPPTPPAPDGSGGTWNFQLHVAFWVGMAMCDSQSHPNYTDKCEPDTDANIFDDPDPTSSHFIGKHPGGAYMEMQFYPPGWVNSPFLSDSQNYFAAVNIFSYEVQAGTGLLNNTACQNSVGVESYNGAVITRDGVPLAPPNPLHLNFGRSRFDLTNVLSMAPGDKVLIILHDTKDGFEVVIKDLTSGESGRMVAGAENGFGDVLFQPTATTCTVVPYNFHPMYATSSEHTRVPWVGHSYNVAFTDEIGHFELPESGLDSDDSRCFNPFAPFQQIAGCTAADTDFDGFSYQLRWPGTNPNLELDRKYHPTPIRFTSPVFISHPDEAVLSGGDQEQSEVLDEDQSWMRFHDYDRVAFETNVAGDAVGACDTFTGNNCVVPPVGAKFYPIFSTATADLDHDSNGGLCTWQFGGAQIRGTTNTFGGNASAEFGPKRSLTFLGVGTNTFVAYGFNRRVVKNPCVAHGRNLVEQEVPYLMQHRE